MPYADVFKSFHLMHSIKALIGKAETLMKGKSQNGKEKAIPALYAKEIMAGNDLSNGLQQLWGKFHALSEKAAIISIHQNVLLAAYHIRCFLEVGLIFIFCET